MEVFRPVFRSRFPLALGLLVAFGSVVSCASPTAPAATDVELEFFHGQEGVLGVWFGPHGAVSWSAYATEDLSRLPGTRVPFEVTTSRGHQAVIEGVPVVCRVGENSYDCRLLTVELHPGADLRQFERKVWALDGIARGGEPVEVGVRTQSMVAQTSSATRLVSVEVFPGSLEHAMRTLRSWPEVRSVQRARAGNNPLIGLSLDHWVRAGFRITTDEALASDRIWKLEEGDTITVRYQNPDGSVLSRHTIVGGGGTIRN